jgi:hypothetical protein
MGIDPEGLRALQQARQQQAAINAYVNNYLNYSLILQSTPDTWSQLLEGVAHVVATLNDAEQEQFVELELVAGLVDALTVAGYVFVNTGGIFIPAGNGFVPIDAADISGLNGAAQFVLQQLFETPGGAQTFSTFISNYVTYMRGVATASPAKLIHGPPRLANWLPAVAATMRVVVSQSSVDDTAAWWEPAPQ